MLTKYHSAGGTNSKELCTLRAVSIKDENIYYTKGYRLYMPIVQKEGTIEGMFWISDNQHKG
jgi:hypothetical protein